MHNAYVLRRLKTHYNDPEKECAKVRKNCRGDFKDKILSNNVGHICIYGTLSQFKGINYEIVFKILSSGWCSQNLQYKDLLPL